MTGVLRVWLAWCASTCLWLNFINCVFPFYFILFCFFSFYLLILGGEFVVLLIYAFIGWFLCVFWTLHQIGCLSPRCLALFLEFWSVLSLGPYFFVSVHLLCCKGQSLRYSPGRATLFAALWHCLWRRGQRGSTTAFSLCFSPPFQWTVLWDWGFLLPLQPSQDFTVRGFSL